MFEWLKWRTSSPLATQVAKLDVCPECHEKTLQERHRAEGYVWKQCRKCHLIFVDEQRGE